MKQMRIKALVLICVPLVTAAVTGGTRYAWDQWHSGPILECPRDLNLGERKRGDIVIGHFVIKNLGKDALRLDDFQTSCSCAGVEQEIDGKRYRIKQLELAPGDAVQLSVRVSVGARPGTSQGVQVGFTTNDPRHPRWIMEVVVRRVTGACFPDPHALLFGILAPREKSSRIIDLYDNGSADRKVEEIRVTHPQRFTAALLTISEEDRQQAHPTAGKLFARIQVTPNTERPGRLDGELQVTVSNDAEIERIPVSGEVVDLAECRPAAMVLPRRVKDHFVRSGQVLIRGRRQGPIEVVVDSVPPDIIAAVREVPGVTNQRLLEIEWRPGEKRNKQLLTERSVRLRIRCDGQDSMLELPIILAENRS